SKSTFIYYLDAVKDDRCIICEGIVSSISATRVSGVQAVPLLGKSASYYQLSLIRNRCSEVWLSLDGDTSDYDKKKIINELYKIGATIWLVTLPVKEISGKKMKDPDDLHEEYLAHF